ncbi:MAG: hypothetical protein KH334_01210 [Clostridiales bacterium]|nr:hypothetical protein [Clostridiales bacterium]
MNWAKKYSRRAVCAVLCVLLLGLLCCCKAEQTPFAISKELMELLWNVDYQTFSSAPTVAFAKKHFESGYLAHFLEDPDAQTSLEQNRQNRLKSHLEDVWDLGLEQQILDGTEYTIQSLQISVFIDSFAPEYPEESFFEQGQRYLLGYQVYFVRQDGALKLAGFSFAPEGEAYLPASEKERLSEAEKQIVLGIAEQYLDARYQVEYESFSAEQVFSFYEKNLSAAFLERDGITLQFLEAQQQEFAQNHVSIRLLDCSLTAADQKMEFFDGENYGYYYHVRASYTYEITADAQYFAKKDLASTKTMEETLYFERQQSGEFCMIGAEYR